MKLFILFTFICFFLTKGVFAALKLNEIYPAPPTGEYEWVEFYNTGPSSIYLSDYFFDDDTDFNSDSGNSAKVNLSGILLEQSTCYWKLSNYLNNTGDEPTLFKADGSPVDSYTYTTTQTGKSYSRIPDGGEWQANVDPTKSSADCSTLTPTPLPSAIPSATLSPTSTPTPTPTSLPTNTPTPEPTPQSYNNIFISEVMVNPSSGENEWVELFNNNDFSVSLKDWFIDDIENAGSSPKLFSLDIPAKNYGVIELSSSMFNNGGDSVRLLDLNKNRVDDFEYASTTQGKTFGRISYDSDEFCLQEPSKGTANNSCINPTPTPNPTPQPTHKPTNTPYLSVTAAVNRSITKSSPVLMNRYINTNNNSAPVNQLIGEGEVLGLSNQNSISSHNLLIRSLSFISFSYSLLTILSLFLKMKNSYEKGL